MRRTKEEAIERAEYLFERLGGDPELVFLLEDGELDPRSVVMNAWLRAVQFLQLGENRLAEAELKLVASTDPEQLQLMIESA